MSFDIYYHWLGIPPKDQPPHHYRLLGIELFEENRDVISVAADRQMTHIRTFQSGPHAAESQKLLNEIAKAVGCLLDPQRKSAYDARLRQTVESPHLIDPPGAGGPLDDEKRFAGYVLLEQLGSSHTGSLFKARDSKIGRLVAVKLLSREATQSPELFKRFIRKARILAGLSHPNLVAAHAVGEWNGTHFLVMEFVDGTDMQSLCQQYGVLPVQHVVNYIIQAAKGLGYAHSKRVLHRNVKLSNLMLDRQGVVRIIGLGIARIDIEGDREHDLTKIGQVIGTCEYMAPEQSLDSRSADHRADIYSLGCTMYKMLTGRTVYQEKSPLRLVRSHREAPIPSLTQVRPDVPISLDIVFQRMLAKLPEQRFQSMDEVIAALQA